jgi:hypothetical protein
MSPGDIVFLMPIIMWLCAFVDTLVLADILFFHQLVGGVDRVQQVLSIGKRPHIVVSVIHFLIFSTKLKFFSTFIYQKMFFLWESKRCF